jgi:hypothetical protein
MPAFWRREKGRLVSCHPNPGADDFGARAVISPIEQTAVENFDTRQPLPASDRPARGSSSFC